MTSLAVGSGAAEPGLLAFGIVAALGVVLYFLIRSMNKQFKKVNFEEKPPPERHEPRDGGDPHDPSQNGDATPRRGGRG